MPIKGIDKLTETITQRLRERLPTDRRSRRIVLEVMRILDYEAQQAYGRSGLERRSGALANSLRSYPESIPDGIRVVMSPRNIKYARIHEFGGTIRAIRGEYLKFQVKPGVWVQKRQVTIRARPYLRPTLVRAHAKIMKVLAEGV